MKDTMLSLLKERRFRVRELCSKLKSTLKTAPAGKLRVVTKKGRGGLPRYQYYVSTTNKIADAKYLPKKQIATAKALAQRDYTRALLSEKEKELAFLTRTIKKFRAEDAITAYESLSAGKRVLVTPLAPTDELYVTSWIKKKYKQNPYPEKPVFKTDSDFLVRSKSEVLIANHLEKMHIPFRYEYPVTLKNGTTIYPDFYILEPKSRREIIWEHHGMMDEQDYRERAIKKINNLIAFGDTTSYSVIHTFETKMEPLTQQIIEGQIARILALSVMYYRA